MRSLACASSASAKASQVGLPLLGTPVWCMGSCWWDYMLEVAAVSAAAAAACVESCCCTPVPGHALPDYRRLQPSSDPVGMILQVSWTSRIWCSSILHLPGAAQSASARTTARCQQLECIEACQSACFTGLQPPSSISSCLLGLRLECSKQQRVQKVPAGQCRHL